MTPSTRATALLIAAVAALLAVATATAFLAGVAVLEHRDERAAGARHAGRPRPVVAEVGACAVSAVVGWYRRENTGLKVGVTSELLALVVAVLMGLTS